MLKFKFGNLIQYIVIFMFMSILYVDQQINIVSAGYDILDNKKAVRTLTDKKMDHMGRVAELTSSKRIMLSMRNMPEKFEIARQKHTVKVEETQTILLAKNNIQKTHPIIEFFQLDRTAYAKSGKIDI